MQTLSKNKLTYLRKFLKKRIRRLQKKCLIEGQKICREALDNGFKIEMLVYSIGKGKDIRDILTHKNVVEVYRADDKDIVSLSEVDTPQGLIGLMSIPEQTDNPGEKNELVLLVLDSISDPGNMGTIIRTAAWYGVDGIICSENCVEITNGKVIRSSMGSVFHIPVWEYIELKENLVNLKKNGYKIYGSAPRGGETFEESSEKKVIIIGSEAQGLSEEVLDLCDGLITIKGSGKAESLNAAVSTGIILDRAMNN